MEAILSWMRETTDHMSPWAGLFILVIYFVLVVPTAWWLFYKHF